MIYLNASDEAAYQASKPFYHDPERLLAARTHGRGVRTLLLKLIDQITLLHDGWRSHVCAVRFFGIGEFTDHGYHQG
jgi:hypothetical protein